MIATTLCICLSDDGKVGVLILEQCIGGDLDGRIAQLRSQREWPELCMTEVDAKFYIASILLGLEAVHAENIVHRVRCIPILRRVDLKDE